MASDPCYQYFTSDQYTKSKTKVTKDLYVDDVDELPPNEPKPRGQTIQMDRFVESYHAGDKVTRISQTGKILYFNSTPIIFY